MENSNCVYNFQCISTFARRDACCRLAVERNGNTKRRAIGQHQLNAMACSGRRDLLMKRQTMFRKQRSEVHIYIHIYITKYPISSNHLHIPRNVIFIMDFLQRELFCQVFNCSTSLFQVKRRANYIFPLTFLCESGVYIS